MPYLCKNLLSCRINIRCGKYCHFFWLERSFNERLTNSLCKTPFFLEKAAKLDSRSARFSSLFLFIFCYIDTF